MVVARDESGLPEATVLDGGAGVAKFIYTQIITHIGYFRVLKTDQGSEFKNQFVRTLVETNRVV